MFNNFSLPIQGPAHGYEHVDTAAGFTEVTGSDYNPQPGAPMLDVAVDAIGPPVNEGPRHSASWKHPGST